MKSFHDSRILRKEFHIGQKVLLFNSHLKLISSKLWSRWNGPFVITNLFPMMQLRLKMKLLAKSSKWTVTNSNFFMRAPSGGGICGGPLFGLANFMWWCALNGTWGVSFPFLLYVVSLFAFHYMLTLRTMYISSVGGGFRKNISIFYFFCFLFLLFLLLFLFLYFVLVFVSVSVLCVYLVVFCFVYFSIFVIVCCSVFVVVVCFLS